MTTTTHRTDHPALALPADERAAYLDVVASFVIADGVADESELGWLGTLCEDLGLDGPAREEVFAAARRPDPARTAATIAAACENAGKRLCTEPEFARACRGPLDGGADYPYGGTTRKPGACNEGKGSSMVLFFGANAANWTFENFNDPRLNQWDGGLAPTGAYAKCASPDGVMDCVGNLHEWGADAPDAKGHSRMRGGFYGDAEINGKGCRYMTSAHGPDYHDYSTGFRCCTDAM